VVRQTVLDSLDEPTRQELNRRVAEGLTRVFDDDIDAWAGSIAEHYAAADELTQALPYHVRAAEHARAEYAHVDAVSHYEDAIECARALSNHDDEILELLEEIGYVNYLVGEIDEAEKHFQYIRERTDESSILQRIARYESSMYADRGEFDRAHECAKRGLSLAGDEQSAETCELFGELGFALLHRGELETAIETFETMSSLAEQLDNTVLAGRALHYLGTAQIRLGDAESAIEQLEAAVETLEDTDEDRKLARSLSNLGIIYWKAGQLGRARELIERAIDLHTRVEDPINHAKTLTNHGILLFFQCLWSEAIERFEESIELSRPLGDKQNVANALGNISFCHERQGDFEAAMEYLTRSIDTYDTIDNDSDDIGTLHAHAARLYYFRDELETARDHAEIALEKAAEQAASEAESEAFRQLGTICRVTGEPKRAIEHHARGIRAAKEGALPALELECRCCLARDLVEVGRADGAVDQLEPVLESSEDVPLQPLLLVKAHRIRGECYRVMGEFDRATEASLTALDQARSLGSVHEEALVRYELGRLARDQAAPHDAREEFRKAASLCPDTGAALLKRRLRSALTTVQKRD
jgi:tetratricopeptide (TPR) repeat protein